jgi:hypothetical protein
MLYAEGYVCVLPLVVHDAAAGHFERFIALSYAIYKSTDDQIARGLQFSVVCSEAMRGLNYDAARRAAATVR